jgi:hypothetical protein
MENPSLEITKYLENEIPVDGICTSCPSVIFQVKALPLSPSAEQGRAKLQKLFDDHAQKVHRI